MDDELRYDMVVFDVGGTLIGFHEWAPFQEFLAGAGQPATDEDARRLHRRLIAVILAERDAAQGLGADEEELLSWWRGNLAKTWPDRPDLAEEMLHWLFAGRFERMHFREMFNPTFVPGIIPLLHDLRGRGYRLGLVTGSARRVVDESLAPTGVLELFVTIVTGDQVSHGKPHPQPYRMAAQQLGFPPARCLAVENAPLGIQSAKAAGMGCVALETTLSAERLSTAGADRIFPDTGTLRTWLLSR